MKKGFTLIELLLVIGIIAVLASIVVVAINPSKQLSSARNSSRSGGLHAILKGSQQYLIDEGTFPDDPILAKPVVNDEVRNVCRLYASIFECAANNGAYLSILSFTGKYFVDIPVDPTQAALCNCTQAGCDVGCWDTGYTITINNNGRLTVAAPLTEGGADPISYTQ